MFWVARLLLTPLLGRKKIQFTAFEVDTISKLIVIYSVYIGEGKESYQTTYLYDKEKKKTWNQFHWINHSESWWSDYLVGLSCSVVKVASNYFFSSEYRWLVTELAHTIYTPYIFQIFHLLINCVWLVQNRNCCNGNRQLIFVPFSKMIIPRGEVFCCLC